jgi:hypothetical protein
MRVLFLSPNTLVWMAIATAWGVGFICGAMVLALWWSHL